MKHHKRNLAAGAIIAISTILAAACLPRRGGQANNAAPTPSSSPAAELPTTPVPTPSVTPVPARTDREDFYRKNVDGQVIGVVDGDTIDVLDDRNATYRIRLAGIDAPEKSQAFGSRSKSNLSDMTYGKRVSVMYNKVDRYGRIVGKVLVDGTDICLRQIQDGMAWHFKRYANEQPEGERASYSQAEQSAREAKKGLWADPNPQPPWERRGR